jgi:nitroimidazol reductase NimA-like FMN-containing flavoprotein (pyridoxamine 5'-phosphate oxidase superfamily)
MRAGRPEFFELSHEDALALLERHHVGRLAFTFHDRVDIEPISYVFADGYVWGRTAQGAKLTTVQHHPWIAIEVDEIEGPFDWRSVVVHGSLQLLADEGGERARQRYARGLELVRHLDPAALTPADLTPDRVVLFRVFVDSVTGRGARTAS